MFLFDYLDFYLNLVFWVSRLSDINFQNVEELISSLQSTSRRKLKNSQKISRYASVAQSSAVREYLSREYEREKGPSIDFDSFRKNFFVYWNFEETKLIIKTLKQTNKQK